MSIHPMAKDTGVLDILIKHYVPDLRLANQYSWLKRGCCLSQPIPNDWHLLHKYHTYKRMASKIRIVGSWFGEGERTIPFLNLTNILYHVYRDMSTPYTIFFLFNQQLILLPSYLHHK